MKKPIVVLVVLLAAAGLAFADLSAGVTGDATLTFGFDLDESNHGFLNETSGSASVTIAGTTKSADGDGWWGELEVELSAIDISSMETFYLTEDGEDGLVWGEFYDADGEAVSFITGEVAVGVNTAKITNGVIYVNILEPSPDVSYAQGFADEDAASYEEMSVAAATPFDETYGFSAGMVGEGILSDIKLLVFSNDDWESGNNEYGVGAQSALNLVPDMITLDLGLFYAGEVFGFGLNPVVDFGMGSLSVGFDTEYVDELSWEVLANIDVDVVDDVSAYADAYYTDEILDTKFGLAAAFAPVSAGVDVSLFDLLADELFWGVAGSLGYSDGGISVDYEAGYDSTETLSMGLSVAADEDFHSINNTTFTLAWSDFEKVGDADATNGAVTLSAGISF